MTAFTQQTARQVDIRAIRHSVAELQTPGRLAYSERQLYYEVCRTLSRRPDTYLPWVPAVAALPLLAARRTAGATRLLAAAVLLGVGQRLVHHAPYTLPPPLSDTAFRAALDACRAHGPLAGLLPTDAAPALPLDREPDLAAYGLPRVLICQHTSVARMLRANLFHLETTCAVFGLDEVQPLAPEVQAMLARTPTARIMVLHDASPAGLALPTRLATDLQLPAGLTPVSIGLRPVHARRLHLFATRRPFTPALAAAWPETLTAAERAWLQQGWQAEVESVRPLRLLRTLRRIVSGDLPAPRRRFDQRRFRELGFMTWPEE